MKATREPEQVRPIDDLALRAVWREDVRRRIAAAGVAFAPGAVPSDLSTLGTADPAALDGWVANPARWPGGADPAEVDRLAAAARDFAAATGVAVDGAVGHPETGMPLPLALDGAARRALSAGRADAPSAALGLFVPPDWRARRSRWINGALRGAARSLAVQRYAVLRGLLTPGYLAALAAYVRALRDAGLMTLGDSQVAWRYRLYDEPAMHGLHGLLVPLVTRVVGAPVVATYAYLATYVDGADLPAHTDRPQCKWNMSLALDQTPDLPLEETWPIYVQPEDRAIAVHLMPGDALIYSGTEVVHGRLPLPAGQTATLCFFHFVEEGFEGALM